MTVTAIYACPRSIYQVNFHPAPSYQYFFILRKVICDFRWRIGCIVIWCREIIKRCHRCTILASGNSGLVIIFVLLHYHTEKPLQSFPNSSIRSLESCPWHIRFRWFQHPLMLYYRTFRVAPLLHYHNYALIIQTSRCLLNYPYPDLWLRLLFSDVFDFWTPS